MQPARMWLDVQVDVVKRAEWSPASGPADTLHMLVYFIVVSFVSS